LIFIFYLIEAKNASISIDTMSIFNDEQRKKNSQIVVSYSLDVPICREKIKNGTRSSGRLWRNGSKIHFDTKRRDFFWV